jgi:pyrroline-5-carboxylate reductase
MTPTEAGRAQLRDHSSREQSTAQGSTKQGAVVTAGDTGPATGTIPAPDAASDKVPAEAPDCATRVLLLGCGRMAGALLEQWHRIPAFDYTAVSPSGSRQLPEGVAAARSMEDLRGAQFDVLVVGIKPQVIPEALPAYATTLRAGGLLLSLAAGVSVARLQDYAPQAGVIRVMPNLPVALGQGVSGLFAAPGTSREHVGLVEAMMRPTGRLVHAASEDELDRITAIAGSGPGFAFELLRTWSNAAQDLGFSAREARELVAATLGGAIALARQRGVAPEVLRDEVTSKNGTTQAGLRALNEDAELDARFQRTLRATYERAQELR